MRVARQLQRHTGLRMPRRAFRAVGQQDHRRARRRALQCRVQVGTRLAERCRLPVRDARHHQRRVAAPDDDVGVLQHVQAQRPVGGHPAPVVGVVFVVSGNRQHAVARPQVAQGTHVGRPGLGRAVGQIARDHHQVGVQGIGLRHHRRHPGFRQQAADVQVGQLHDAVAVEGRRQARHGQLQVLDVGHPHRLPGADGRQDQGQRAQGQVQRPPDQDGPSRAARDQVHQPRRHVAQQQEHRQQQDRAEGPAQADEDALGQFRRSQRAEEAADEPVVLGHQEEHERQGGARADAPRQGPDEAHQHVQPDGAGDERQQGTHGSKRNAVKGVILT
ncbi:hypothetical protein CDEN61S_01451 [Castellaniella denitrificans]